MFTFEVLNILFFLFFSFRLDDLAFRLFFYNFELSLQIFFGSFFTKTIFFHDLEMNRWRYLYGFLNKKSSCGYVTNISFLLNQKHVCLLIWLLKNK
jgi:hypothetical protein